MTSTGPNLAASESHAFAIRWTSTRIRLMAAGLVSLAAWCLALSLEQELRILLAYDFGLATYCAMLVVRMFNADGETTRVLAEKKETSHRLILTLAGILSVCSLAGVGFMLQRSQNWTPLMANMHLGLSLLAVFLSWTLLHITFGLHYAKLYYDPTPPPGECPDTRPLEFPTDELPDFLDFMYFAFTLAVCYQVSDISIRSRHLRRVALAHVIVSFLNVTMILGLVVEIVSTLANPVGPSQ